MRKVFIVLLIACLVPVFSFADSLLGETEVFEEENETLQMFSFEDLGINDESSAEDIMKKALALEHLAGALMSLNEQRQIDVEIRLQEVKALQQEMKIEQGRMKNQLALIKEQNKMLKSKRKMFELKLRSMDLRSQ